MTEPVAPSVEIAAAESKTDRIIIRVMSTFFWFCLGVVVAGLVGGGIGVLLFALIGLGLSGWSIWRTDTFSGYLRVPGHVLYGVLQLINLFR